MSQQAVRQNAPGFHIQNDRDEGRELPIGSELMIAVALGSAGWWVIARLVIWIAG